MIFFVPLLKSPQCDCQGDDMQFSALGDESYRLDFV